jgi:hypothetical protein
MAAGVRRRKWSMATATFVTLPHAGVRKLSRYSRAESMTRRWGSAYATACSEQGCRIACVVRFPPCWGREGRCPQHPRRCSSASSAFPGLSLSACEMTILAETLAAWFRLRRLRACCAASWASERGCPGLSGRARKRLRFRLCRRQRIQRGMPRAWAGIVCRVHPRLRRAGCRGRLDIGWCVLRRSGGEFVRRAAVRPIRSPIPGR